MTVRSAIVLTLLVLFGAMGAEVQLVGHITGHPTGGEILLVYLGAFSASAATLVVCMKRVDAKERIRKEQLHRQVYGIPGTRCQQPCWYAGCKFKCEKGEGHSGFHYCDKNWHERTGIWKNYPRDDGWGESRADL